jgi:hypothetical protein
MKSANPTYRSLAIGSSSVIASNRDVRSSNGFVVRYPTATDRRRNARCCRVVWQGHRCDWGSITLPCAACWINSTSTGQSSFAAAAIRSHCVVAGIGIPRCSCSLSNRLNGTPVPYFNRAIIATAVSSYLSAPAGDAHAAKVSVRNFHQLTRQLQSVNPVKRKFGHGQHRSSHPTSQVQYPVATGNRKRSQHQFAIRPT